MIVKDTKRNIQRLFQYKQNFDLMLSVSEIESEINGAKIQSYIFDFYESEKLLKNYIKSKLNISEEEYNKIFNKLEKINAYSFMNEPYLRNIKLKEVNKNDFSIKKVFYKQNEFCFIDLYQQDSDLNRKQSIGVFDDIASTYALYKNDELIDIVNPMEINMRAKTLRNINGIVLIFGLGLGYLPYMASLKDEVKKVIIVEENADVIDLFNDNILPFFENKHKIEIVNGDLSKYVEYINNYNCDCVVVDNLENSEFDQGIYKVLITQEKDFPKINFYYSFEECYLSDMIINIYQYFSAKLGTDDFQKYFKLIAEKIWTEMDKIQDTISVPDDMNRYLNYDFAKKIIQNI